MALGITQLKCCRKSYVVTLDLAAMSVSYSNNPPLPLHMFKNTPLMNN